MTDWMLLKTPYALLLYSVSLILCLYDKYRDASKGVLTLISAFFAISSLVLLLLYGTSLQEAATMLLVLLLLNMGDK